ncbi:MAG TPA: HAD family hydrolase [Acidobacteriota bacterium]|nr:HAD family hydrolase [Acidobacteriota bacterium]
MCFRPQAVFFDLFNTLLHFDYERLPLVDHRGLARRTTMLKVHRELTREWGLTHTLSAFLEAFDEATREMYRLKGGGREYPSLARFELLRQRLGLADKAVSERMVEVHMEGMYSMMHRPPEHLEMLQQLQGVPKVLASNFDHAPTARRALKAFGLEAHLDHIFISDEVGWRKPAPQFFQAICRQSGFEPSRCVFVGDDPEADAGGAGRAGFQVAWLRDGRSLTPSPAPRWTLERVTDLPAILESASSTG